MEMSPIDDDEEFLHNVIHEGTDHPPSLEDDAPEDDGRQYCQIRDYRTAYVT
jgi:hypothetical protein